MRHFIKDSCSSSLLLDCRLPSRRRWSAVHLRLTAPRRGRRCPPLRSLPSSPPLLTRATSPLVTICLYGALAPRPGFGIGASEVLYGRKRSLGGGHRDTTCAPNAMARKTSCVTSLRLPFCMASIDACVSWLVAVWLYTRRNPMAHKYIKPS